MILEDGSLFFPSLPRRINQASLLDFMFMMTLMQRRMDTVMPVPDTQNRTTVENRRFPDSAQKVQDSSQETQGDG